MTRNKIISMAREAGSIDSEDVIETVWTAFTAAEREQCAKVCDEQGVGRKALEHYAALTYSGAAHDCAAAIRARGEK